MITPSGRTHHSYPQGACVSTFATFSGLQYKLKKTINTKAMNSTSIQSPFLQHFQSRTSNMACDTVNKSAQHGVESFRHCNKQSGGANLWSELRPIKTGRTIIAITKKPRMRVIHASGSKLTWFSRPIMFYAGLNLKMKLMCLPLMYHMHNLLSHAHK